MSILLQVNSNDRLPIYHLWRLIFKYTFDKKNCSPNAHKIIEQEVLKWNKLVITQNKIKNDRFGPAIDSHISVGKKGTVLDEIEYQVGLMASWVRDEERGDFRSRIDSYKRAGIDWRKCKPMDRFFPEVKKNFAAGQLALKQNMKDNPEHYK